MSWQQPSPASSDSIKSSSIASGASAATGQGQSAAVVVGGSMARSGAFILCERVRTTRRVRVLENGTTVCIARESASIVDALGKNKAAKNVVCFLCRAQKKSGCRPSNPKLVPTWRCFFRRFLIYTAATLFTQRRRYLQHDLSQGFVCESTTAFLQPTQVQPVWCQFGVARKRNYGNERCDPSPSGQTNQGCFSSRIDQRPNGKKGGRTRVHAPSGF